MKSFFISLNILLLLSGCATKNAFSKFDMNSQQELSASSLRSSKIVSGKRVDGICSAIYLNEVYPDSFNQNEYFFVSVYLKIKEEMYNPNSLDEIGLVLKLNSKLPLKIKQLPHANRFSHLTSMQNNWTNYYLVAFEEEKGETLNLLLENGRSSSAVLKYQKGEQ